VPSLQHVPADTTLFERSRKLMEADLGDELLALDVEGGQCFGFNDVATAVWKLLEQPRSFAELRDVLLADYDVSSAQCSADLAELLDSLGERGLVKRR